MIISGGQMPRAACPSFFLVIESKRKEMIVLDTTHYFHFYGPVTMVSFRSLMDILLQATAQHGCQKAVLCISSEGGDLNSGFTAYNFLRALKVDLTAINTGTVESIAVPIFLAADHRLVLNNSRFLLHSFHWNFLNAPVDHTRLAEHSDSLQFDAKRYAEIFQERTNGADDPINIADCLNGPARILDASASISTGLAHQIIQSQDALTFGGTAVHWWVNHF